MDHQPSSQHLPQPQLIAERAFRTLQRILRVEAFSGVMLLVAATIALIWANSGFFSAYQHLWHLPISIGAGEILFSKPLHFWINDALMTIFFLVVGMEIRREIHEGALSTLDQAILPVIAAFGGVVVPALIYVLVNVGSVSRQGWAIPTATDIAFAVGVLALLGRAVPVNVRVFLLTLAIIDDVIAVLVIAFFYSGGFQLGGLVVAAFGILTVLILQRIGIGSAFAYTPSGAIVWVGFLMTGAHPTLAGVVLGLMTPVRSLPMSDRPLNILSRAVDELQVADAKSETHRLEAPLRDVRAAHREILPPVVRVQASLHPWVAFGIMPLFALSNAGINFGAVDHSGEVGFVVLGVSIALAVGKPVGVFGATWLAVRLGWCRLAPGVCWRGVLLVGLLAGIGFTMSIFIAMLAFHDDSLLKAAKLGVLLGSLTAAILGLVWGVGYVRHLRER